MSSPSRTAALRKRPPSGKISSGKPGRPAALHQKKLPQLQRAERERETDEDDSSQGSQSPAAAPAGSSRGGSFLSQILSVQKPQKKETDLPDDVQAWLQYGGASTAADQAILQAAQDAEEDGSAPAPSAEEEAEVCEEVMPSPASAPLKPWYDEPEPPADAACFVHFIPPPMRENGKKHLPWIIHTCDGSGCREARHVVFNSICGFSTYEGAPPEQLRGTACSCPIANHHLRGVGRVRWEKDGSAVIEHHRSAEGDAPDVRLNIKAVREEARHRSQQLGRAVAEVKKLRELTTNLSHQLDAAIAANVEGADGAVKELASLKLKKRDLDERHRTLHGKYEALAAKHADEAAARREQECQAAAAASAAAASAAEAERIAAQIGEAEAAMAGRPQLSLGPWRCVLVCLPRNS